MRWLAVFTSIVLLMACIAVDATHPSGGPPPPTPPIFNSPDAAGTVVVLETEGNRVTIGYENTTAMTLKWVTVRCRAFDAAGFQTGVQDVTIEGAVDGPIGPGFKVRKWMNLAGPPAATITCGVTAAEADR